MDATNERGPGRGEWKILVIAQDVIAAEAFLRVVHLTGHWGYAAASVKEALSIWAAHGREFDMVICDSKLAAIKPIPLEQALRETGTAPRMILVGTRQDDPRATSSQHPVLAKPLTASIMQQTFEQVMGRS